MSAPLLPCAREQQPSLPAPPWHKRDLLTLSRELTTPSSMSTTTARACSSGRAQQVCCSALGCTQAAAHSLVGTLSLRAASAGRHSGPVLYTAALNPRCSSLRALRSMMGRSLSGRTGRSSGGSCRESTLRKMLRGARGSAAEGWEAAGGRGPLGCYMSRWERHPLARQPALWCTRALQWLQPAPTLPGPHLLMPSSNSPSVLCAACSRRASSQNRPASWLPHWPTWTVISSLGIWGGGAVCSQVQQGQSRGGIWPLDGKDTEGSLSAGRGRNGIGGRCTRLAVQVRGAPGCCAPAAFQDLPHGSPSLLHDIATKSVTVGVSIPLSARWRTELLERAHH